MPSSQSSDSSSSNAPSKSSITSFFPEAFYDIIAYMAPGFLLISGIVYHTDSISVLVTEGKTANSEFQSYLLSLLDAQWIVLIFFGLLFLGILYSIGLILSTLSIPLVRDIILLIVPLLKKIAIRYYKFRGKSKDIKIVKKQEMKNLVRFGYLMLEVRIRETGYIALTMVKRYARFILVRNVTLVSLILSFYCWALLVGNRAELFVPSIFKECWHLPMSWTLFTILMYIVFYYRQEWMLGYFQILKSSKKSAIKDCYDLSKVFKN